MNLPDNALALLGDVELYWLKIEVVVHEEELLGSILEKTACVCKHE